MTKPERVTSKGKIGIFCGACGVPMIATKFSYVRANEGDVCVWCEDCIRIARPRRIHGSPLKEEL